MLSRCHHLYTHNCDFMGGDSSGGSGLTFGIRVCILGQD